MLPLVFYTETRGPFKAPRTLNGFTALFTAYRRDIAGYRQKQPYNVPTWYESTEYKGTGYMDADSWSWSAFQYGASAANQARAQFVGKLGDSSSFGATLTAELRETQNLVVGGITKLLRAARAVKKLRFFEAASLLGLPYTEKLVKRVHYRYEIVSKKNGLGRRRVRHRVVTYQTKMDWGTGRLHAKTLASGWLLWSYGVKPIAEDIHNAMQVLTRELPTTKVIGRGRQTTKWRTNLSSAIYVVRQAEVRVKCQAYVRVNNPNLWLANQLGLINPVQWVNEAIPFSFVLDWFSNLSQVISQLTDFVGLDVLEPCTVTIGIGHETQYENGSKWYDIQHTKVARSLTIPTATLTFAYERFSWQRGLNAISLLIGFLPKSSKT